MKALFLGLILNSQALAPSSPFFHHQALSTEDIRLFHTLVDEADPRDSGRVLLVGYQDDWIIPLYNAGLIVYGVTTRDAYKFGYQKVENYRNLPFRAAFFRIVCLFEQADVSILFEMDRLLVREGYVWLVDQGIFDVKKFLGYLRYTRTGMPFHQMTVWRKQGNA